MAKRAGMELAEPAINIIDQRFISVTHMLSMLDANEIMVNVEDYLTDNEFAYDAKASKAQIVYQVVDKET